MGKKPKAPVESALLDIHRVFVDSAIKMSSKSGSGIC
jgi:hypothetical protein